MRCGCFEPLTGDDHADPATANYQKAFALLEASDPGAIAAFAAHVGTFPRDKLGSFHLKRLLNGEIGTQIAMQ